MECISKLAKIKKTKKRLKSLGIPDRMLNNKCVSAGQKKSARKHKKHELGKAASFAAKQRRIQTNA